MHTDTDHFPGNPGLDRRTHLASKNRFARAFCFLSSKCGHAARSHLNPVRRASTLGPAMTSEAFVYIALPGETTFVTAGRLVLVTAVPLDPIEP
jgi:hypothetical protein